MRCRNLGVVVQSLDKRVFVHLALVNLHRIVARWHRQLRSRRFKRGLFWLLALGLAREWLGLELGERRHLDHRLQQVCNNRLFLSFLGRPQLMVQVWIATSLLL